MKTRRLNFLLLLIVLLFANITIVNAINGYSIKPTSIVQNEQVMFIMVSQNTEDFSISLDTETNLSFTDGITTYHATLYSVITIASGSSKTTLFCLESVPASFTSGNYIPTISYHGTTSGQLYTQTLSLSTETVVVYPNVNTLSSIVDMIPQKITNYFYSYPFLVWMVNTSTAPIILSNNTRLSISDNTYLYATACISAPLTLTANQTTKVEFQYSVVQNIPVGFYTTKLTVFSDSFSQSLSLGNMVVQVVSDYVNSIGAGPSSINKSLSTQANDTVAITAGVSGVTYDFLLTVDLNTGKSGAGSYASPSFCDIDGDGDYDFFSGGTWGYNGTGPVTFSQNTGTNSSPQWGKFNPIIQPMLTSQYSHPAFVDIDNDSDFDMFVGDESGKIWLFRNTGSMYTAKWNNGPREYPGLSIGSAASPCFGDLDGDGDNDLLIGCRNGNIWVAENVGNNTVPSYTTAIQYSSTSVSNYSAPALVDIDNDGDCDLFIGADNGFITYVANTGNINIPLWGALVSNFSGISVGTRAVPTFVDIDHDVDYDLFVGNGTTAIKFYRNQGTSSSPIFVEELSPLTYMEPNYKPLNVNLLPNYQSLLSNPLLVYGRDVNGGSRIDMNFIDSYNGCDTTDIILNNKYSGGIYIRNRGNPITPEGGIGVGVGVKIRTDIIYDNNAEASITSIHSSLVSTYRNQSFDFGVEMKCNKNYTLGIITSNPASHIIFTNNSIDVSNKFSYSIVTSVGNLTNLSSATVTFRVLPAGDAPLGEIMIDPVILTSGLSTTYVNQGSMEWPIQKVLSITLLPSNQILVDKTAITIAEGSTNIFKAKLLDQPTMDTTTVSIIYVSGDADITVVSTDNWIFDKVNWNTYQTVTVMASYDTDNINGVAYIECSSPNYASATVAATEADDEYILTSMTQIVVPENSQVQLSVKLGGPPHSVITVYSIWGSGDPDINVQSGQLLVFDSTDWSAFKPFVLSANHDINFSFNTTWISSTSAGYTPKEVLCLEGEDDIPTWTKYYRSSSKENTFRSLKSLDDGSMVALGLCVNWGTSNYDLWMTKISQTGEIMWQKQYTGSDREEPFSALEYTFDQGFICGGYTRSFGSIDDDGLIVKFDLNGNIQWQKVFGGNIAEAILSIKETKDSGFVLGGYTSSYGFGEADIWIIKLDHVGDVVWQKAFGGLFSESLKAITLSDTSCYVMAGNTNSIGSGSNDILVFKLDPEGNILWQKVYGGAANEEPSSIITTRDDGLVVVGGTQSYGMGDWDIWVLKLNNAGDVVWEKTFGGIGYDFGKAVVQTKDNGYLITGDTYSSGTGGQNILMIKLDTTGSIVWQKVYEGRDYDEAGNLVEESIDGSYIVPGTMKLGGGSPRNALIIKTNPDGDVVPFGVPFDDATIYQMVSNAIVNNSNLSFSSTTVIFRPSGLTTGNCNAEINVICQAPMLRSNMSQVLLAINSAGYYALDLNMQPTSNVTATIVNYSGDTDITIQSSTTLIYTPTTWGTQSITLKSPVVMNPLYGVATIRCTAPGWVYKDIGTIVINTTYKRVIQNNGITVFHLGINTTYTPITLSVNSVGSSDTVTISLYDNKHPNAPSAYYLSRWYRILHTGGIMSANLKMIYTNSDFSDSNLYSKNEMEIAKYDSGSWSWYSPNSEDTVNNWIQLNNVNSFSDWTMSGPGGVPVELSGFEAIREE